MFELCPKCNGRKTIGKACSYCGAGGTTKKATKKPAAKKPRKKA